MGEFSYTVLSACVSILVIELISQLFPDKSEGFVRGCAALLVCTSVLIGFLRTDHEWLDTRTRSYSSDFSELDMKQNTVEYGIMLLKQRLHTVLDAAGISVSGGENGIEIRYRLSEEDEIEIERVLVRLRYSTDTDRAYSILRSILTELIPVEVYTE